MSRIHLFEFEDQSWFPDIIRKGITDYLQYAANRIDLYNSLIPVIKKGIEKSGTKRIVDLCSGGGGGTKGIMKHLNEEMPGVRLTLTDKFPNVPAFKTIASELHGQVDYREDSIDATNVPQDLKGMRTMLVAFHHFRPEMARKILADASRQGAVIGIFEATERSLINFIGMLFTPLVVMLAVPFIRPFKWSRIFLTYIIPLIPLFTMWDGIVSVLRTYSTKELDTLTASVAAPGYRWETGKIVKKKGPNIIYLLGYPS